MQRDSQLHEYHYIKEYSTANEHGARRKSNFQSRSTMDVQMAEKDYDKRRLLTTIRDEIDPNGSNNSSTGFRHGY